MMDQYEYPEVSKIIGLTPRTIEQFDDEIHMYFTDGSSCRFYHSQDCCEYVVIEDVNGEWGDLIGHPLLTADERVSYDEAFESLDESNTWTFYSFRGVGGSVDVRWHGSSNGYYSESVDFHFTPAPENNQ